MHGRPRRVSITCTVPVGRQFDAWIRARQPPQGSARACDAGEDLAALLGTDYKSVEATLSAVCVQSWRQKSREQSLRAQVIGDGHAPGQFRAQTVRNLDAWYETFKVKDGAKLYLAPEQRVKIW